LDLPLDFTTIFSVNGNEPGHAVRAYVVDLESANARPITLEGIMATAPSPDGKFVAGVDA
jgi:hypothetical protein